MLAVLMLLGLTVKSVQLGLLDLMPALMVIAVGLMVAPVLGVLGDFRTRDSPENCCPVHDGSGRS